MTDETMIDSDCPQLQDPTLATNFTNTDPENSETETNVVSKRMPSSSTDSLPTSSQVTDNDSVNSNCITPRIISRDALFSSKTDNLRTNNNHRHNSHLGLCLGETSPTSTRVETPKHVYRSRHSSTGGTNNGTRVPDGILSSPARDKSSRKRKESAIRKASEPVDVKTLQQLAISQGGLLSDILRKTAWPNLLSVDVNNIPPRPDIETLHGHRDYPQVVLDVNRSLKRFPPGMEEDYRLSLQDQLVDVIMHVLVTHPHLHYYQGYHDIVVTFLLVVGEEMTFALMDKLSNLHLKDFMDKNMDRTKYMLSYLYPIIGRSNKELRDFLERSEVGTIFCLSWLITWFGHVLNDLPSIVRLYDYFIACHPLMPIYLAAAIVLYRQNEVLAVECEMCMVHSLLSRIPDNLPFEDLLILSGDLFILHPPKELTSEAEEIYNLSINPPKPVSVESTSPKKRRRNTPRSSNKWKVSKATWISVIVVVGAAAIAYFHKSTYIQWLWS